jgi:hypothetical protein
MVTVVLPLLLAGIGLVLLVLGLFLARRSLRDGEQTPTAAEPRRVPQVQ